MTNRKMSNEKAQIIIGNIPIKPEVLDDCYDITEYQEAKAMAIEALEQESITWIVGNDNCQVAVRNMPIDKMLKICAIIGDEEQQPCEDCITELIREFDNKHSALFADYMREFNNHPISEIIEYMWDMHDLIEDIKYRLPNEGDAESEDEE